MDVQKRLQQYMKSRGWTAYRLAEKAGLSHSTIKNLFSRNNTPTIPTLEIICKAFGITMSEFFAEGDESMKLSEDQRELLERWISLTPEQKAVLLDLMRVM